MPGIDETENSYRVRQFDPGECMDGAMDNGETFATTDVADGVQGVVCKRSADGGTEVQSFVFDKAKFTEDQVKEWIAKSDATGATVRSSHRNASVWGGPFSDYQTLQSQDGPLLASDAITNVLDMIQTALADKGWTYQTQNPAFDFVVNHVFDDAVIAQDFLSAKHYKIPYTITGDMVNLGVPEETDLAFVPMGSAPDNKQPSMPPAPGMAEKRVRSQFRCDMAPPAKPVSVVSPGKHETEKKRPVYDVLIMSSGFTADDLEHKRYITKEALTGAVAGRVFDNARCFWQHPDENGRRVDMPVGFVKAGTARIENNIAGEVDCYAHVVLFNPDKHPHAAMLQEVLEASLQEGTPFTRNSFYGNVDWGWEMMQGRAVETWYKITSADAVDFVDRPAIPRTGVRSRVAANRQTSQSQTGALSMNEREELAALRTKQTALDQQLADATKKADEATKRADRVELEKAVDEELAKSGLPDPLRLSTRPILLSIADKDLRTAQLEQTKVLYWRGTKRSDTGTNAAPTDPQAKTAALPEAVRDKVAAAAKSLGIKPELLEAAQRKTMGVEL